MSQNEILLNPEELTLFDYSGFLMNLQVQITKSISKIADRSRTLDPSLLSEIEQAKRQLLELAQSLKEFKAIINMHPILRERIIYEKKYENYSSELKILQGLLRKTFLKVKKDQTELSQVNYLNLVNRRSNEVEDLIKIPLIDQEGIIKQSSKITSDLYRTLDMLTERVDHADAISKEFQSHEHMLKDVETDGFTVGKNIREGKEWISLVRRREFTDKVLIIIAFAFFISVCLYIMKSRLRIPFL